MHIPRTGFEQAYSFETRQGGQQCGVAGLDAGNNGVEGWKY